jgi:hypothetical protein
MSGPPIFITVLRFGAPANGDNPLQCALQAVAGLGPRRPRRTY